MEGQVPDEPGQPEQFAVVAAADELDVPLLQEPDADVAGARDVVEFADAFDAALVVFEVDVVVLLVALASVAIGHPIILIRIINLSILPNTTNTPNTISIVVCQQHSSSTHIHDKMLTRSKPWIYHYLVLYASAFCSFYTPLSSTCIQYH